MMDIKTSLWDNGIYHTFEQVWLIKPAEMCRLAKAFTAHNIQKIDENWNSDQKLDL